jgi:TPR repeat protein
VRHATSSASVALVLNLCLGVAGTAGPLEDGLAAAQRGDWAAALHYWQPLADQGDPSAQNNLGALFARARQDYVEAAKWYRKSAEQGDATAQNNLAQMYYDGHGVVEDYVEAAKWYRKSAEQGDATAQSNLAQMYYDGRGVVQDYVEAAKWYRKSAAQGYAPALNNLGLMYNEGLGGVAQDYAEALKWYGKSANQGNATAQFNLGAMYSRGLGVSQDYAEAHKWFNLAAAQGDDDAKKSRDYIATLMTPDQIAEAQLRARKWKLENGVDLPQDYDEAVLRKRAEQGDAAAQYSLGLKSESGQGVLQDYAEAHKWFNLAAALGNKVAEKNRDRIAKSMTRDQIAEAQRRAREWKPEVGADGAH